MDDYSTKPSAVKHHLRNGQRAKRDPIPVIISLKETSSAGSQGGEGGAGARTSRTDGQRETEKEAWAGPRVATIYLLTPLGGGELTSHIHDALGSRRVGLDPDTD